VRSLSTVRDTALVHLTMRAWKVSSSSTTGLRWHEADDNLRAWYQAGQLKNSDVVTEGLEHMAAALADRFSGGNRGTRIGRVAPDPEELPT
jgi:NADPH-dependent curcumin reductase CurA